MKAIRSLGSLMLLLPAAALHVSALAQESAASYPSKPVAVIVTLAPGGPVDIEARAYSQKLTEFVGRQFIVDNKPGASGTIAIAYVAKAPPNGYTLLLGSVSMTITPLFYKDKMQYDVFKDFAPISLMGIAPVLLLANISMPASLSEIIAVSKTRPGGLNFGTVGAGSAIHLNGLFLASTTGTKMTFIHYKGTSALMGDLVEGRLQLAVTNPTLGMTFVNSGKLRLIGVSSKTRMKSMRDVKTVAELGATGYSFYGWTGFFAPARTPSAIINKLNAEMDKVAKSPDILAKFERQGTEMVGGPPENLAKYIAEEYSRWGKIIREANIELEE